VPFILDHSYDGVKQDYAALLSNLKKMAPKLLAVDVAGPNGSDSVNVQIKEMAEKDGVPFLAISLPDGSTLPDHIHLNANGNRIWVSAMTSAIDAAFGSATAPAASHMAISPN
jgi:hypothetical protein